MTVTLDAEGAVGRCAGVRASRRERVSFRTAFYSHARRELVDRCVHVENALTVEEEASLLEWLDRRWDPKYWTEYRYGRLNDDGAVSARTPRRRRDGDPTREK